ncbi:MAG TPA: two-component sensor histidine kinase, partial [Desulfosporosinus sp.]|nr:two-component sensor histidine kinase [Desulfosporosinus sp.]
MLFIRLRNKILLLNMLLTSVVMIIAFAAIYLIMNNNIQAENMRKLETISGGQFSVVTSETNDNASSDAVAVDLAEERLSVDYSVSFSIKVDKYGT